MPFRSNPFADVAATQYYYQPVLWAYYHNVVAGTSASLPPKKTVKLPAASIAPT